MRDTNKNKRIKMLRRMQGLPTVGDIILESVAGILFIGVLVLGYLAIKLM